MLADLLRHVCGPSCVVADYRVVLSRDDYAVVVAQLAHPHEKVVVKLAGPGAALACPFDRTAAIVGMVRARTNVPTFDVLAASISYRDWPWRYMVTTYQPGTTWADGHARLDEAQRRGVYRQLGEAVAGLHAVRFAQYGEIGADGTVVDGTSCRVALAARARRRIANPRHAALFVALLEERAALFDDVRGAALTHEDLNPTNILLRPEGERWRLSALLDFDSAWAGNPESDLARLELWRGMTGDGFHRAYEAVAPISPGYRQRRPVYQLLWCLEYASPSPQHLADTARVCSELGIAPVRFP